MSTIAKALASVTFFSMLWFIWSPSFASMFMPPVEIVWDGSSLESSQELSQESSPGSSRFLSLGSSLGCSVRFEPSRDKQFFYQFLIRNKSDSPQEAELVFTPTLVKFVMRYQDQNRTSLRLNPNELRSIEIPELMQPGIPRVLYDPSGFEMKIWQSTVQQQLELMKTSMGTAYIEPSAGTRDNIMRFRVVIMGALIGVYSTIGVRQHHQTKQRPRSHDEEVHTQSWRVWEDHTSEHPHTTARETNEAEHASDERFRASFLSRKKPLGPYEYYIADSDKNSEDKKGQEEIEKRD